jgi:hypothetical protein
MKRLKEILKGARPSNTWGTDAQAAYAVRIAEPLEALAAAQRETNHLLTVIAQGLARTADSWEQREKGNPAGQAGLSGQAADEVKP